MYHSFKAAVARCIYSAYPSAVSHTPTKRLSPALMGAHRSPIHAPSASVMRTRRVQLRRPPAEVTSTSKIRRSSTFNTNLRGEPHSGELSCPLRIARLFSPLNLVCAVCIRAKLHCLSTQSWCRVCWSSTYAGKLRRQQMLRCVGRRSPPELGASPAAETAGANRQRDGER